MIETELTNDDKLRLRANIKMPLVFSSLLCIVFINVCVAMFMLGKLPLNGFMNSSIAIIAFFFIALLSILLLQKNLLQYIDFKKSKKLVFTTNDYEIISEKDESFIVVKSHNNYKIKIENELVYLIKLAKPLTLEISSFNKSLLFISHNNNNLLDNLYNNYKQDY